MSSRSHARHRLRLRGLPLILVVALSVSACAGDQDQGQADNGAEGAGDYPSEPIVFRLPAPGSQTEAVGRAFAVGWSEVSPVDIEVDPIPTGGTDEALFSALQDPDAADGHIVGLITNSSVVSTATEAAAFGIDDFQAVAQIAQVPIGLAVRQDSPWDSFEDFAEAAEDDASNIRVGLTGTPGSLIHIAAVQVGEAIGIAGEFAIVPAGTSGESILDLMGGGVDVVAGAAAGFVEGVEAGDLRVLATTGVERMSSLPDVDTLTELGYDVEIVNPIQIVASSQVPRERIEILSDLVSAAMERSDVQDSLLELGWEPQFEDAQTTQGAIQDMYDEARELAEELGLI